MSQSPQPEQEGQGEKQGQADKHRRDRAALLALAASTGAALALGLAVWAGYAIGARGRGEGCPNPCPGNSSGQGCTVPKDHCADYASTDPVNSLLLDMPTVIAVALIVLAFIPGWVRAMRFPQPRIAKTIMTAIGALAIFAAWHGAIYVVYVATLAILAAFIGEMVRKDGRENLLGQVAGTYVGCLAVSSAALWVSVARVDARWMTSMVAVMILFGSLGRYATKTGRTVRRSSSAKWALPAWLTICAFASGAVLVTTIEPTASPGPYLWVLAIALGFGVSASLADLAASSVTRRPVAVSLAVLPHCVLGAIGYASLLIVQ